MNNDKIIIMKNNAWNSNETPYVTVVTPSYNREKTILRAMRSIENQTYRNIEYIVVDDGSTDNSSEIISNFMNNTWIPMMLIKKENGGVHTARNIAIKYARGKMYYCNDSDDESLPQAIEKLIYIWQHIPDKERKEYFEIKARCKTQDGHEVGPKFPNNINDWKWENLKKYYESIKAENVGFRVMSILKENPWPEPFGVTFVGEDFLWKKLRQKYKTYLSNEIVQVYHTEGNDHLDFNLTQSRNIQQCRNVYWRTTYVLNNYDLYGEKNRGKLILSRRMMWNILCMKNGKKNKIKLTNDKNKIIDFVLTPIAFIMSIIYMCKYEVKNEK